MQFSKCSQPALLFVFMHTARPRLGIMMRRKYRNQYSLVFDFQAGSKKSY